MSSMQVKDVIIRLKNKKKKKHNRAIRNIAEALGVTKLTIWYILKKRECICEFTTSGQVKKPSHISVKL